MSEELKIYTDGACRGNPGPAAVGFVIKRGGTAVKEVSRVIGEATNNIAEYRAIIMALEEALEMKADKVSLFTDSQLVYRQVIGEYKIKLPHIRQLCGRVQELRNKIRDFSIQHIPRERNTAADKLASTALK